MAIKIDSINLYVNDIVKSIEFYRNLGFNVIKSDKNDDYAKIELKNSIKLTFYDKKVVKDFFGSKINLKSKSNQFNISIRLETPELVDKLYQQLIKIGVTSVNSPVNSDWGQRNAFIFDPDENLIELNAIIEK